MKTQISISVDEELLELVDEMLKEGIYRNKSHLFELAVKNMLNHQKIKAADNIREINI